MRAAILFAALVSCSGSGSPSSPPTPSVVPRGSSSATPFASSSAAAPADGGDTETIPREEDFAEEARQKINQENLADELEKLEREVEADEP